MAITVVGQTSGVFAEVETNTLALRAVARPHDVRAYSFCGSYMTGFLSTGNGSIPWFFNAGPTTALIKKIYFSLSNSATSSQPITVKWTYLRAVTTLPVLSVSQSSVCKLRTSFADPRSGITSNVAVTGASDAQPVASLVSSTLTAVATNLGLGSYDVLESGGDRTPLVVEPSAGLLPAITPALIAIQYSITYVWDEYLLPR